MNLLDWIVYAVVITAVIGLTAWSVDGVLRALGRPSRWLWLAAMTLSVGVPGVALVLDSSSVALAPGSAQALAVPLRSNPGRVASAAIVFRTASTLLEDAQVWLAHAVVRGGDALSELPLDETSIRRGWAAASLTLTLVLVVAFARLRHDARTWRKSTIEGREVWISRTIGPASVGVARPRVVLPEWTTGLEPQELALVLAHEEEHARARDPMLLGLAWIPVVVMPWNPFLWWQFRRLAGAVEVDCDRRVLGRGVNRRNYLALLIRLAARTRGDRGLLPSVARFASPLKTRMEAMIGRRRFVHLGFLTALLVGLSFAAVACGPGVPEAIRESAAPPPYDPVRVFRNTQLLDFGPLIVVEGPRGELSIQRGQPQDVSQDSMRLLAIQAGQRLNVAQDSTPLRIFPAGQDTTNARPCEYWRVNRDGTTSTGPGLVVNARCVPREEAGGFVGLLNFGPPPGNHPPCVYWVPNPDSLITRPGVIWGGRCGPAGQRGARPIPIAP